MIVILLQLVSQAKHLVVSGELVALGSLDRVVNGVHPRHPTFLSHGGLHVEEQAVRVGRRGEHAVELLGGFDAAVEEGVQTAESRCLDKCPVVIQCLEVEHHLLDFRIADELSGLLDGL